MDQYGEGSSDATSPVSYDYDDYYYYYYYYYGLFFLFTLKYRKNVYKDAMSSKASPMYAA